MKKAKKAAERQAKIDAGEDPDDEGDDDEDAGKDAADIETLSDKEYEGFKNVGEVCCIAAEALTQQVSHC